VTMKKAIIIGTCILLSLLMMGCEDKKTYEQGYKEGYGEAMLYVADMCYSDGFHSNNLTYVGVTSGGCMFFNQSDFKDCLDSGFCKSNDLEGKK